MTRAELEHLIGWLTWAAQQPDEQRIPALLWVVLGNVSVADAEQLRRRITT